MHDILKEIISKRIMHVEAVKANYTKEQRLEIYKEARAKKRRIRISFKEALTSPKSGRAVIAEFKRASPSKGDINIDADPRAQALKYEKNGATAMSILTEPEYFKGRLKDIKRASQATSLPILCKDFIVDSIQIDFAKLSGADAVLLIVGALTESKLKDLYAHARSLGLDVLVESHNQLELMKALKLKDAIIGMNNRNLKTFKTDITQTERLMALVPQNTLVVSESGIKTVEDLEYLKSVGAGAFLIGESLMQMGSDQKQQTFMAKSKKPKVKMCGLTRLSDIRIANELELDYVGFVFAKSSRQVSVEQACRLISGLDKRIKAVGVFVNRSKEDVQRIAEICKLDVIQLHGDERLENYEMDRPVWKSVAVKTQGQNLSDENAIDELCAGLLYDKFDPSQAGGTGQTFQWIKELPAGQHFRIAAGGISIGNVEDCVRTLKPDIVDISSGIESSGKKDPEKMRSFVKKVKTMMFI